MDFYTQTELAPGPMGHFMCFSFTLLSQEKSGIIEVNGDYSRGTPLEVKSGGFVLQGSNVWGEVSRRHKPVLCD